MRNDSDLRRAIESHGQDEFKRHFAYDYNRNPPKAIQNSISRAPPEWDSCILPHSAQGKWAEKVAVSYCGYGLLVPTSYGQRILTINQFRKFGAMNPVLRGNCTCMPALSILIPFLETVQNDLKDQLANIVSDVPISKRGTWVSRPLDRPYNPDRRENSANSAAFNGYVYYYTNLATTSNDYDASLTYVMIFGVCVFHFSIWMSL